MKGVLLLIIRRFPDKNKSFVERVIHMYLSKRTYPFFLLKINNLSTALKSSVSTRTEGDANWKEKLELAEPHDDVNRRASMLQLSTRLSVFLQHQQISGSPNEKSEGMNGIIAMHGTAAASSNILSSLGKHFHFLLGEENLQWLPNVFMNNRQGCMISMRLRRNHTREKFSETSMIHEWTADCRSKLCKNILTDWNFCKFSSKNFLLVFLMAEIFIHCKKKFK